MHKILSNICEGKGKPGDLETLEELSEVAEVASLCALGKSGPSPFLSTLRHFRDEYVAHIEEKRCPSLSCKKLITIYIDPEACKACLICLRKCPSQAISGGKNEIHVIDQDLCGACGVCVEVCPPKFDAIRTISGMPAPPPWPKEQRMIERARGS